MRIIFFVFLGFSLIFSAFSQNAKTDRRIEEEKRLSLQSSEVIAVGLNPANEVTNRDHTSQYLNQLFLKKITRRYDLYKVITIILGVESEYIDFDSQFEFLKRNNIIDQSLAVEAKLDKPLQRGFTAYLFCRVLDLKGGVLTRIFGFNERRAIRELAFQDIIKGGNLSDYISGKELIVILTQVANFVAQGQTEKRINN